MNRRWLYPYYVIVVLLLLMWLTGCDGPSGSPQANSSFSVEGHVTNAESTLSPTKTDGRWETVSEGKNTRTLSLVP